MSKLCAVRLVNFPNQTACVKHGKHNILLFRNEFQLLATEPKEKNLVMKWFFLFVSTDAGWQSMIMVKISSIFQAAVT